MKKLISRLYLFMLVVVMMLCFTTTAFATNDLDNLNSGNQNNSTQQGSSDNSSVSDYLKGYTPVTDKNMSDASQYASPIVNIIGTITGFIVMCVSAAIFCITALDLAYIGLPFTRGWLNPQQAQPQGGMGMGGMGMGGSQPQADTGLRKRWVSDEAVACVAMSSPQASQGGASPMGGMGMGMGGMGMGGMGGSQPQAQSTKSVIMMYLKKRTFFIIVFTVATILLTSSIFTDCGINLGELLFKIMDKVNSLISGVNI